MADNKDVKQPGPPAAPAQPQTSPPELKAPVSQDAPPKAPKPPKAVAAEPTPAAPPGGIPVELSHFFMVKEHITPASRERPGAKRQYVAGHFYPADPFLSALWHSGDPAVVPHKPEG